MSRKRKNGDRGDDIFRIWTDWSQVYEELKCLGTDTNSLVKMAEEAFFTCSFMETYRTSTDIGSFQEVISNFIRSTIPCYNDVKYHTFEHAIHVLLNIRCLLSSIPTERITPLEGFALLFSALIHDLDHLGMPNATLVKLNHPYALTYNDLSVAEMRSISVAYGLFENENSNILIFLDTDQKIKFRKIVINVVLSTDIADVEKKYLFQSKVSRNCDEDVSSHRSNPNPPPDPNPTPT